MFITHFRERTHGQVSFRLRLACTGSSLEEDDCRTRRGQLWSVEKIVIRPGFVFYISEAAPWARIL